MRQVPSYLIIGNGRVARHFAYYFTQLAIDYECWSRSDSIENLNLKLKRKTYVLILISDYAIEAYIRSHLAGASNVLIHFSGSLNTSLAIGCHPLMTFSYELYPLETYKSIPFVLDDDAPDWAELFPGLPNPHVRLNKQSKAKYHAMAVMAGNFSCMLWQKLFKTFEQEFGFEKEIALPYLKQQTTNLMQSSDVLTGPLVRNDQKTITNNLDAMKDDAFYAVYQAFVSAYMRESV